MEKKNQSASQPEKRDNNSGERSGLNDYIRYTGMGFQMLAVIGLFTWVGIKLDEKWSLEKPVFTAILAMIGVIIGIYSALKDFIQKK
ncbi:MAG: AtpZ/AtpI family protein [Bacteroidales bacterium]